MHDFLVGVFSRQISLCRNFHSKVGVGVISVEYGNYMLYILKGIRGVSGFHLGLKVGGGGEVRKMFLHSHIC